MSFPKLSLALVNFYTRAFASRLLLNPSGQVMESFNLLELFILAWYKGPPVHSRARSSRIGTKSGSAWMYNIVRNIVNVHFGRATLEKQSIACHLNVETVNS